MKKRAGNYLSHMMGMYLLVLRAVSAVNTLVGAEITICMDKPGAALRPTLYGAFLR